MAYKSVIVCDYCGKETPIDPHEYVQKQELITPKDWILIDGLKNNRDENHYHVGNQYVCSVRCVVKLALAHAQTYEDSHVFDKDVATN